MSSTTATRSRSSVSALVLVALTLTLLDGSLTYRWLVADLAVEGNPLLDAFVSDLGAGAAMSLRVLVGCVLVLALAVLARCHDVALTGLRVTAGILGLVVSYHVVGGTITYLLTA